MKDVKMIFVQASQHEIALQKINGIIHFFSTMKTTFPVQIHITFMLIKKYQLLIQIEICIETGTL